MYRETRHIVSGLGAGSYYLHTSYAVWSTYYFLCFCICLSAQKLQNYQIKIDATWTWYKYVSWWLLGEVARLWSHFALAFELWPSYILDKKIGYNLKTTGQIVMPYCMLVGSLNRKKWRWPLYLWLWKLTRTAAGRGLCSLGHILWWFVQKFLYFRSTWNDVHGWSGREEEYEECADLSEGCIETW